MTAARDLREEHRALLDLVRAVASREVAPLAAGCERTGRFPREAFEQLAGLGLLGLPLSDDVGGGGVPYRVACMCVEELARAFLAVGLGVSVHTLVARAVDRFADPEQRQRLVPDLAAGRLLGAYALSEPDSGSDAAALATRAVRDGDVWRLTGTKAWVTHAGEAGRYLVMARTGEQGPGGISAFVLDADQAGLSVAAPEDKLALRASPTAQLHLADAPVPADRLIGGEGQGFRVAMAALDAGRLGIAAAAVGLAQAALDTASAYARQRRQFGRPIIDFQGVGFLLADMATGIEAARALYRDVAARYDRGEQVTAQAAMSKLFASDMAMRAATDAVQVLGGYGTVTDLPAERYLREAKILQIVEGTNQIQRVVISRHLAGRR